MSTATAPKRLSIQRVNKGSNPSLSTLLMWGMHRRRLSGNALATLAGIDQSIVSRLVSGRRINPMPETVDSLSWALDIPVVKIWDAQRVSRALADAGMSTAPDVKIRKNHP